MLNSLSIAIWLIKCCLRSFSCNSLSVVIKYVLRTYFITTANGHFISFFLNLAGACRMGDGEAAAAIGQSLALDWIRAVLFSLEGRHGKFDSPGHISAGYFSFGAVACAIC